jgi:hypothetical protein
VSRPILAIRGFPPHVPGVRVDASVVEHQAPLPHRTAHGGDVSRPPGTTGWQPQETQFKKKFTDWRKSIHEASTQPNSAVNDEKKQNEAQRRLQELYSQRTNSMKEDMTGFVWLYLKK